MKTQDWSGLAEWIDDSLLFLDIKDDPKMNTMHSSIHKSWRKSVIVPVKHFSRCHVGHIGPIADYGETMVVESVKESDLESKLDVCIMTDGESSEHLCRVVRTHRVENAKSLRSIGVHQFGLPIYRIAFLDVLRDGRYATFQHHIFQRNSNWYDAVRYYDRNANALPPCPLDDELQDAVSKACSAQFAQEFFWHLEVGLDNGPTAMIGTNPAGIREAFKLREKTGDRRRALANWVREHFRTKRSESASHKEEAEVLIKSFMRGDSGFTWEGYTFKIHPSRSDLRVFSKAWGPVRPAPWRKSEA